MRVSEDKVVGDIVPLVPTEAVPLYDPPNLAPYERVRRSTTSATTTFAYSFVGPLAWN